MILRTPLLALSCLAMIAGCEQRPPMAPVKGIVLLGDKPMQGGRIMFEPLARGDDKLIGKSAFGDVREDGTFELSTYEDGDGAVVGVHHPTVFGERVEDGEERRGPNIGVVRLERLELEVKAGQENQFEIKLTPQDVRLDAIQDD